MTRMKKALSAGKFVVTSEVGPPKGVNVGKCIEDAAALKERITAFNVTDLQSAVMRFGSLATCRLLLERGLEPILQMTCRDRNRLALQSDLLSAYGLGIKNVLCLTGDHQKLGDHQEAKGLCSYFTQRQHFSRAGIWPVTNWTGPPNFFWEQ